MTRPIVRQRDTEEMIDQLEQILGDKLAKLKGWVPETLDDLKMLERIQRQVLALCKEKREAMRERELYKTPDLTPEERQKLFDRLDRETRRRAA